MLANIVATKRKRHKAILGVFPKWCTSLINQFNPQTQLANLGEELNAPFFEIARCAFFECGDG